MKDQGSQPELFATVSEPPAKEFYCWKFMIRSEVYSGYGTTLREALADVGRSMGLTGMQETIYRNMLRLYKPELISHETAKRSLEQKQQGQ
jgi:hypothetical protein